MTRPEGSAAYWPPMPAAPRLRQVAIATKDGDILMGAERVKVASWEQFTRELEQRNLECVCGPLPGWRWFNDAAADDRTYVSLGRNGGIRAVIWQGRKRRFWVLAASVWGRRPDASLCRDLTILGEQTGLGQWGTPSRLGDALQRRAWVQDRGWVLESRPNLKAREDLLLGGIGGRGETMRLGATTEHCWEIDQRDAYAHAWAQPHPSGPAMMTLDATRVSRGAATAHGPIRFTIHAKLHCPAPLPIRLPEGNLQWPTLPGVYFGHAWAEEVADARACGITVEPTGQGWEWGKWTTSRAWTDEVGEIRRHAGGWGSLLKLATVASIGRHGRKPVGWCRVEGGAEGDIGFSPWGHFYGQRPVDLPSMTHWHQHAVMRARRRVWHRAVAEQWAGRRVLAIETDSLVLDGPPMGPVVLRGDDLAGEWSIRRSDQTVFTPLTRWAIFEDGSGRTPGLPFELRAEWLAANGPSP